MNRLPPLLTTTLLILATARTACAIAVAMGTEKELLKIAEAYVEKNPKDAEGYYCIGRIRMTVWAHSLQEDGRITYMGLTEPKKLPSFPPWDSVMLMRPGPEPYVPPGPRLVELQQVVREDEPPGEKKGAPVDDAAGLARAVEAYRKAVSLDGGDRSLYHLALACAYEEVARVAGRMPADFDYGMKDELSAAEKQRCDRAIKDLAAEEPATRERATRELEEMVPAAAPYLAKLKPADEEVQARLHRVLGKYWQLQAVQEYRKAYRATVEMNLAMPQYDSLSDKMVAAEAGERMLVLFKHVPEAAKAGEIDAVTKAVTAINAKEHTMMNF
jgi:hypothetical protein